MTAGYQNIIVLYGQEREKLVDQGHFRDDNSLSSATGFSSFRHSSGDSLI